MSTAISQHAMFIDGDFRPALDGATSEIVDPATGQSIAVVPQASAKDVDEAVAAADRAFTSWSQTAPAERALALLRLADRVESAAEELARIESGNVGKPMGLAREEMEMIADHLRFFAGAGRSLEGRAAGEYMTARTSIIRRDPIGVVGSVAPWNYPLLMATWKLGPALMAGNTVVLKPSEHTPLTALRLAELAADLLPAGVLNIITGDGDPVGVALVSHPRVRMSSLTGDVATGREVMRAAANSNLKRLHLELGGKAPVIVLDDADLELTVAKIREGAFCNSGQDCMAASRVYATESVHDELVSALVPAVTSLQVGSPQSDEVEMGPVVSAAQRDRVNSFVERAGQTGHAELVVGEHGGDDAGFFVAPTIVLGAQQRDEIVQREVFGPVISVTRASNDDIVGWANDVEYGLAASVFTSNVTRALDIARRLQFGTVWINDHLPVVAEMPHGGFKQSGNGKDMSIYSIEEYTEIKHVMINLEAA
ncbi:MAG: gamma-aminobutyraldehyde dehydrogenase [Solirubrobacterales bacterium]|nr:gamma-aminobutyraldehyde dehydrogenase [Solirubrobacterales bacterium]